jgi:hypothetical protein
VDAFFWRGVHNAINVSRIFYFFFVFAQKGGQFDAISVFIHATEPYTLNII